MNPTATAAALVCVVSSLSFASAALAEAPDPRSAPEITEVTEASEADREPADLQLDEEIIVSANLVATERAQVGSSVTVVDAADIARHRFATVSEALRLVPGLELSRVGGPGQVTSAFVRGGSSAQTLVLLDGVRLNAATTGAFDLAGLSTEGVERIEILRGAQSPLYGSEAAAGVISIVTRRQTASTLSVLAEAGQGDHARLRLGAGGSFGSSRSNGEGGSSGDGREASWRLGGEWLETAGVSAADPRAGNEEDDALDALTFDGSLAGSTGRGRTLDLSVRSLDQRLDVDGFAFLAGPVDDLDAVNDRVSRQAALRGTTPLRGVARGADSPQLLLRFGWFDEELEGRDPGNPFGAFTVENQRFEAGARADLALGRSDRLGVDSPRHLVSLGVDAERREGASVGSYTEERDISAVFVQDRWRLADRATLTAGARYDDHDAFGSETTWRVATSVGLGRAREVGRYRLHGSVGTGFRAPSFADLFFPGFGNPALRAETSRTADLGVEARVGGWLLDATAFRGEFDDLIVFDFVTFLPQNVAEAETEGIELAATWRGERWDVRATHTWLDTLDVGSGQSLARRPDARTTLDLGYRVSERWRFAAAAVAVGDRIDSDATELEPYERLDLSAHGRFGERFEPYVRVSNVFDDETSEVAGYGALGRTALVGIAARW